MMRPLTSNVINVIREIGKVPTKTIEVFGEQVQKILKATRDAWTGESHTLSMTQQQNEHTFATRRIEMAYQQVLEQLHNERDALRSRLQAAEKSGEMEANIKRLELQKDEEIAKLNARRDQAIAQIQEDSERFKALLKEHGKTVRNRDNNYSAKAAVADFTSLVRSSPLRTLEGTVDVTSSDQEGVRYKVSLKAEFFQGPSPIAFSTISTFIPPSFLELPSVETAIPSKTKTQVFFWLYLENPQEISEALYIAGIPDDSPIDKDEHENWGARDNWQFQKKGENIYYLTVTIPNRDKPYPYKIRGRNKSLWWTRGDNMELLLDGTIKHRVVIFYRPAESRVVPLRAEDSVWLIGDSKETIELDAHGEKNSSGKITEPDLYSTTTTVLACSDAMETFPYQFIVNQDRGRKKEPKHQLTKSTPTFPADHNDIDVPKDNNCLFWAAAIALLWSRVWDDAAFNVMYQRLFGETGSITLSNGEKVPINALATKQQVKEMLIAYQGNIEKLLQNRHTILGILICEIFRNRVVDQLDTTFINPKDREAIVAEAHYSNWLEYVKKMRRADVAWGGDPEMKAISQLARVNIQVFKPGYNPPPYLFEGSEHTVFLRHVDGGTHYHFGLKRDIYAQLISMPISAAILSPLLSSSNPKVTVTFFLYWQMQLGAKFEVPYLAGIGKPDSTDKHDWGAREEWKFTKKGSWQNTETQEHVFCLTKDITVRKGYYQFKVRDHSGSLWMTWHDNLKLFETEDMGEHHVVVLYRPHNLSLEKSKEESVALVHGPDWQDNPHALEPQGNPVKAPELYKKEFVWKSSQRPKFDFFKIVKRRNIDGASVIQSWHPPTARGDNLDAENLFKI